MLGRAPVSLGPQHSVVTYADLQKNATCIRALYADHAIELPPMSGLGTLCDEADALDSAWNEGTIDSETNERLFRVAHFRRVSEAVIELRRTPDPAPYLQRLKSGSLDPFDRNESDAKNILWEVDLWRILRERGVDAELIEPPDIAAKLPAGRLVIACKHLYSELNVAKVLSGAVGQIKTAGHPGIVSFCLDDLLPRGALLTARGFASALEMLNSKNMEFLARHERYFLRYMQPKRILGVLISTGTVADIQGADQRLNTIREHAFWVIPDMTPSETALIRCLTDAMATRGGASDVR